MKPDPLPAAFIAFVQGYARSEHFTCPRRLFRGLVFRWCLWRDGNPENAFPGYTACPEEDLRTGFPHGWNQRRISDLCREAIGTKAVSRARRVAAAHH